MCRLHELFLSQASPGAVFVPHTNLVLVPTGGWEEAGNLISTKCALNHAGMGLTTSITRCEGFLQCRSKLPSHRVIGRRHVRLL